MRALLNWAAGVIFGIGLERWFFPLPEKVLWVTIVFVTGAMLAAAVNREVSA